MTLWQIALSLPVVWIGWHLLLDDDRTEDQT